MLYVAVIAMLCFAMFSCTQEPSTTPNEVETATPEVTPNEIETVTPEPEVVTPAEPEDILPEVLNGENTVPL